MRAALLQLCSSDDPRSNLRIASEMLRHAKSEGAHFVLTPEVTNCVSMSRDHQARVLRHESEDVVLDGLREDAARLGIWVLAGSLALRADPPETRFVNRSILIDADGGIAARYDKMHMFDVQITEGETFRESAAFAPGNRAVVAETPFGTIGMTVCYDLRFPYLHRALAEAGAEIIAVPSAFSPATGPRHWEPLLKARAIESGAYILAPAQVGLHPASEGKRRMTYGHSLAVSPWGDLLLDAGTMIGVHFVDVDLAEVQTARRKVPSLQHARTFEGPR